ncbi:MAG: S-formylglutathione hydrolase, partial [Phycisphaerales bacterium]|nr:S-formylglutathione hydrolase [Phycisphaerales bacterium]
MTIETISENKSFGGVQGVYAHDAASTACSMRFSVYLPPQAESGKVPLIYWLSGLTCTEENFTTKAGAQRYAAEAGVALVAPDTSPRGDGVADDEAYDFGKGAGFYVNATEAPWSAHYRMYDYVVEELPALVALRFPVDAGRAGVMGHSMGGHGALVVGLRNPDRFRSISAFAPICAPMRCSWGEKALGGYLGSDREAWR